MSNLLILLLINLAAWPTWQWYFSRICDPQDYLTSSMVLGTILFFLSKELISNFKQLPCKQTQVGLSSSANATTLSSSQSAVIILLLAIYAVLNTVALPMIQALAIVVLNVFVISICFKQIGKLPAFWILCLLALPIIPSLQYYLGYPLRSLIANVTAWCLSSQHIQATVEGAMLSINSVQVGIDEPCSGIRYLWCSLFAASILAILYKLNAKKTFLSILAGTGLAIVFNIVRTGNLALIEFGIQQGFTSTRNLGHGSLLNGLVHQGIGLTTYAIMLFTLFSIIKYLSRSTGSVQNVQIPAPNITSPTQRAKYVVILATVIVALIPLTCKANTEYGAGSELSTKQALDNPQETSAHQRFCQEQLSILSPLTSPESNSPADQKVSLSPQNLTSKEAKFYSNFPGYISKFHGPKEEFIFRTIYKPTRMVHSSLECFAGTGYTISDQGIVQDNHKRLWRQFKAKKDKTLFLVQEQIFDQHGNSWTDLSQWYWNCLFQKTFGPWHTVTIVKAQ